MNRINLNAVLAGITSVFPSARVSLDHNHPTCMRQEPGVHLHVSVNNYNVLEPIYPSCPTEQLVLRVVSNLATGIATQKMRGIVQ